ncbi:dynein regulatory complex subunit 6-like isoform X2 [Xenia sp. Carnegie-2017]|nr:dynein regulatory complex subunit 6-like isoform X2 [Xenia sp. Carnegie-2017]
MYQRAYSLYNLKLKLVCFKAWNIFYVTKKETRIELESKLTYARRYFRLRTLRNSFMKFYNWYSEIRKTRIDMSAKIKRVLKMALLRMVFTSWLKVVSDSKKTREYFERIERGEIIDAGEYSEFFETKDGKDVISSLPKHVALRIFVNVDIQDLGRCASVSRSWKLIIQSSLLWSKIDFTKMKNRLTNKVVARLVHRYRSVLGHLNLRGCFNLTVKSLMIISVSKNLQDLNVSECEGIDDEVIKSIAAGCSSLLYLNLSRCNISDAALRSLARNCVNLQYLNVSFCRGFTDKGLGYVSHGKGARKLSYLDLSGCEQVTEFGFMSLSLGCLSLSTLVLNNLPELRDDDLQMLCEKCNSVKMISMLNSPLVSDVGIRYFTSFRRLERLYIEGNHRITDTSIKALAKSCPELFQIYITDCPRLTDLSLKALSSCREIVVLNVADCVRIQDAGVRQIVEGPSGAKLREINLTNCVRVSDVSLLRIAQRCHNLTYCSICYCEHVTDAGVELLATLPSLVSLDVSGCNIQDHGVSSLGNSSRLKDITLAECHRITDIGLQKMFQQCRYLENLDLSYCVNITDHAIKNLAFCCRILRTLDLSGCKKLTDSSVQYLAGVCHYITHLNLSACVRLTDRSLRFMRKGLKRLKSLNILYCLNISKSGVKKIINKGYNVHHSNIHPPVFMTTMINPKQPIQPSKSLTMR